MRQLFNLTLVAILSSLFSIFIFRFFVGPQRVVINGNENSTDFVGLPVVSKNNQFNIAALPDFSTVVPDITQTVVTVKALSKADSYFWQSSEIATSSGSGVIISPNGYIVTNHHVIEDALDFEITLSSGKIKQASLIGIDPSTDLAVLKIEDFQRLPYLAFGDSDSLFIGEWVLAVGNPFNLESTVTAGIVSAKSRSINILEGKYSIESFIQTDAAVNPGNSGGALVDGKGNLIGINTAIVTRSGKFDGYSFAIPSNLVQKVSQDLIEYGMVQRGILGISVSKLSPEMAEEEDVDGLSGVLVTEVHENGSAERANLKSGDIIISINEYAIKSVSQLQERIGLARPGDKLRLVYARDGSTYESIATLAAPELEKVDERNFLANLGFTFRDFKPSEKAKHDQGGVVVQTIDKNSRIADINMEEGFIITKVNEKEINSKKELLNFLIQHQTDILLEGFYPNYAGEYYYQFKNY